MKVSTAILGGCSALLLMAAGLKGVVMAENSPGADTRFVVVFDGTTKRVAETSARTVAEVVRAFGIDLAAGDQVEPSMATEITDSPFYVNIYRAKLSSKVAELIRTGRSPLDDRQAATLAAWVPTPVEVLEVVPIEAPPVELPKKTITQVITHALGLGPEFKGTEQKIAWLDQAGVPEADWGYADFIIFKESSWNPNAVNRSSGACGLAQALPCSKIGPNWNDPIVAIKWQYDYVTKRYGGYAGAYRFWQSHHWY